MVRVRDLDALSRYTLLLHSYRSKPFRHSSKAYNHLVDQFTQEMGNRKYNGVQWFFTNLANALKLGHSAMTIKLDSKYWSSNKAGIGYRQVKGVVDWMQENGFVTLYTGSKNIVAEWRSYPSVLKFEQKLLDLIDVQSVRLYIPDDRLEFPIVLKDRVTKKAIDLDITEEVMNMAQQMDSYNESVDAVRVEFNGEPVPMIEYKRSFSGNLFQGGRLFVHGGSVQLIPERYRLKYLTIDGERVAEIDYRAIHAALLYENVAQQEPSVYALANEGFDPYKADRSFMIVDDMEVAKHKVKFGLKKYDPVRNLYKRALMMAINNQNRTKAWGALNTDIHKDSKLDPEDRRYVGLFKPDSNKVLEAVAEHNELIEDHFYKDNGVKLQFVDSRIALRVIDYLVQEGQTCLAYHDSFAVKESVAPLLESAMISAWKDVMGENKFCFVERK